MKSHILGISLLYGRFMAVAIEKGEAHSAWECPYPVGDIESLRQALTESVNATEYNGKYISFVFEDALCEHQLINTPPMKRKDLRRYITRKASQLKTFAGDAVISFSAAKSPKGGAAVLVNILPKSFMQDLMLACRELDLFPIQLTPLSAIMGRQFKRLPIQNDEIVMIVSESSKKLILAVGKSDGSVLMDRYLVYERETAMDIDWLGREIQRSVLFSKQQFGIGAQRALMLGDFSDDIIKRLREQVDIPIEKSGIVVDPFFWVNESLALSARQDSNFITPGLQRLAIRHRMFKVAMVALLFLWLGSIASAGMIEVMIRAEKQSLKALEPHYAGIKEEKAEWDKRYDELNSWKRGIDKVREIRSSPPVAGWFIGYLGDALPADLILKKMVIEKDGTGWNVELTGEALKSATLSAAKLKQFENRLQQGPYKVNVTKSWKEQWVDLLRSGSGSMLGGQEFSLNGRIQ